MPFSNAWFLMPATGAAASNEGNWRVKLGYSHRQNHEHAMRNSMGREINPFGLRMSPDLREMVKREAKLNGRSLNAEIVARLQTSIGPSQRSGAARAAVHARDAEGLSDAERAMLAVFRKLPAEKQLALLSLFQFP